MPNCRTPDPQSSRSHGLRVCRPCPTPANAFDRQVTTWSLSILKSSQRLALRLTKINMAAATQPKLLQEPLCCITPLFFLSSR